ncbi:DUF1295 domain-containing protein [Marinicauda pacifica]|uniref:DUF1295 domain-containing protein n=2 Tax=Marinicauda pacifica TaxID=1133559 RepID=A0A4S2HEG5_9PROT|nr:DUF1295 domain-containing protein [Marinicauda pacifica]
MGGGRRLYPARLDDGGRGRADPRSDNRRCGPGRRSVAGWSAGFRRRRGLLPRPGRTPDAGGGDTMTLLVNLISAYALVMACVIALWFLSMRIRNVSIIDMFWGAGFGLISILLLLINRPGTLYPLLIAAMPLIWSLRYTAFIFQRNWGKGEDARYTKLRSWAETDAAFNKLALKKVFLLQGHIMVIVALPVIVALSLSGPPALPVLMWIGAAIWLTGVLVEATADRQLKAFRADPEKRGQILDTGLWRYSRHPNYFGDAVMWWGVFIAASANPLALPTVVGPILMTHFLINVTGVATLDKKMAREKPGYADYMARTSGFVPWPPKAKAAPR